MENKTNVNKVSVVGGQMSYARLTNKMSEQDYETAKIRIWFHMLQKNMAPKKWLKPSKNGTKVNFDQISTQEQADQALDQLEVFMKSVNRRFGTDYKLQGKDESN